MDHLLLGTSIGKDVLLDLLCESAKSQTVKVRATRIQAKKRSEDEFRYNVLDEQDGAAPNAVGMEADTPPAEPSPVVADSTTLANDEADSLPTPAVAPEGGEDVPLPSLEPHERDEFLACAVNDDSLSKVKAHADKQEMGYSWDSGIVMHEQDVVYIGSVKRIVVPKKFRPVILDLAHKHAGHLGIAKVRALLAPFYTWPGIHTDVRAHCLSCTVCQVAKRSVPPLAPNQSMPIRSHSKRWLPTLWVLSQDLFVGSSIFLPLCVWHPSTRMSYHLGTCPQPLWLKVWWKSFPGQVSIGCSLVIRAPSLCLA